MKPAFLFTVFVSIISNIYAQKEEACWHYTYEKYFKVRAGWGGYEQSGNPIVSKAFFGEAECMASANLLEGKVTSNNIYEWIKYRIVKGCSCTLTKPEKKSGWKNDKKSEMYQSALTQNTKDWYLDYMKSQINPINKENLLQVVALFPKNELLGLVLENMGTVVGAVSFAKWYIDESNNTMQDALNKSLQLLNFPIEKRAEFLTASAALLDSYSGEFIPEFNSYLKSIPYSKGDTTNLDNFMDDNSTWSQKAAIGAINNWVDKRDENSKYQLAANLALAGGIIVANGDKEIGAIYLQKALNELKLIKNTTLISKLKNSIDDLNRTYQLNLK
jgi:hypothetical protein